MIWKCLTCTQQWNAPDVDGNILCPFCNGVNTGKITVTEGQTSFRIENRIVTTDDSDFVVNVLITSDEPLPHHQFVVPLEKLCRELQTLYGRDDEV